MTTDPAVEAAYRALQDALTKAAPPPKDRAELTEMYRQRRYAEIDQMRQDGRLDHILTAEPDEPPVTSKQANLPSQRPRPAGGSVPNVPPRNLP